VLVAPGAVVGVAWKHFAETGAVKANSVIIAAGGFAMNPDMVAEYTPALGQERKTKHHGMVAPYILGNPNDDGLGIRMGVSAGGVATNMDHLFITAAAYPFLTIANANVIHRFGSEAQQAKYLGPLLAGRYFGTMALTEPQAGSSLADIATRATDTNVPEETRLYYIYALRGRSTPQISNRLVQTYLRRGTNPDVMKAAAIAAGFGGDDSTSDLLVPMLAGNDRQDDNLRFSAAIAVVLCGNARAANALLDLLITNDMLAGMLQNEFTPRSAMPNATVQPENWSLLPMTPAMFADGRIYRRVEVASILEQGRNNKHFGWALNQLTTRLKNGWESAMGIGAYQIRTLLREAALGSDRARQDMAFKALRALNDRGSLMALRRQTRAPAAAERARREILEMSSGSGGA